MADEKDIKAEELTDEQANEVSGGGVVERFKIEKKIFNCRNYPHCREKVSDRGKRCEKCMAEWYGN